MHEFVIYTSSEGGNERWELMLKLIQFAGVYFPNLNPNSYDDLNYMKSVQMTRAFSLKIRVIKVF